MKVLWILLLVLVSLCVCATSSLFGSGTGTRSGGIGSSNPITLTNSALSGETLFTKNNRCQFIRCAPGTTCDPLSNTCYPYSCEARNACPEGFECVSLGDVDRSKCQSVPCKRFKCQKLMPVDIMGHGGDGVEEDEEEYEVVEAKDCKTSCGRSVKYGEKFQDDGENYCNACTCMENGVPACTEMGCDLKNAKKKECKGCKTTCGKFVPVGEGFYDDGDNYCNRCNCQENGNAACTLMFCSADKTKSKCD